MECLHTCTCRAPCVCVCVRVCCAVYILFSSCLELLPLPNRIHYERQTSWPGPAWPGDDDDAGPSICPGCLPPKFHHPPSSGVSCIGSGRNRFRTFHASSPDQREHATREFAWAKQKPLALSQALFIVNEIAETTTTTTTTRTSRAGPCK